MTKRDVYLDQCVKCVRIRSYFWFVFCCFRNEYGDTGIYGVNLCIQSECRKIRTRNNSVFGHISRSGCLAEFSILFWVCCKYWKLPDGLVWWFSCKLSIHFAQLAKVFCYTYCVKYMPDYGFSLNLTFSYKNRMVNPVLTRKITGGHRKPVFRHILGSDWYHLGNLYSVRVWDHSLSTFTDIFEKLRFLIPPFLPCFFEENLGFSQSHVIVSCEIVNSFLQKSPLLIFVSALNTQVSAFPKANF